MGAIKAIFIILVSLIITIAFNEFCKNKIGGITGDNLGASNELVEIVTLMVAVIMV